MRTEEYQNFDRKLSTINRNFTHGLFLGEQFLVDHSKQIRKFPETMTSVLFTKNSYHKKFNFRLKNIPSEIINYQKASFEGFYIFMYSIYELYTEDLFEFVGDVLKKKMIKHKNNSYLENIFNNIGIPINSIISNRDINTLEYIRLRRNSLVHASGIPSKKLLDLITNDGQKMNNHWKSTTIKLKLLDFSLAPVKDFDEEEIIDSIMILRDIVRRIDNALLNTIEKENLINYLILLFKKDFKKVAKARPRRVMERKFLRFAEMKLNIKKNEIDFTKLVF